MLPDTRIIHRHGFFEVVAERERVSWPDGTAVHLNEVYVTAGGTSTREQFLRALILDHAHIFVFDLKDAAAELSEEVINTHAIDIPGLIFYTLRGHYKTAEDFIDRVQAKCQAAWFADSQIEQRAAA